MKSAKELKKELFNDFPNGYKTMQEAELKEADAFAQKYMAFLQKNKTERETVESTIEILEKNGFTAFDESGKTKYSAGDKIYKNQRGKALIAAVIGEEPIENGVKIAISHIDSPRLDLKPMPAYESDEMAFFKTHYYGGIKKYQWTAIPLSLHGVICKTNGETITVNIGEDKGDPQFVITDLLPHLAQEQMKRDASKIVQAEELNVLIGSVPFKDDEESELVKLNILNILYEKYGVKERDFLSAELCVVPAFEVREIGFDRSFIGGYGHDDSVCAYPAMMALIDCDKPRKTMLTVFADKEETGSDGDTGMQGAFLKYFIADLARPYGFDGRDVMKNSSCLSADVNAGYDPTFGDVQDKRNCAFINHGVCVTKYTGHGGKYGSNDASAEFMCEVRKILDETKVVWQIGEMGKVDNGGGGTVAKYVSMMDIRTVDIGVPVLSMHAPYEIISKVDLYAAYRAFLEYFKA